MTKGKSRTASDSAAQASPVPPWPFYDEDEVEAAAGVLRSGRVNYWTGNIGRQFEKACAGRFGQPHALALANGSLALELALRALGVGPGDEVIVSPRSFVISASVAELLGATAVFADIDPESQGLSAETIRPCITQRTRAIIPVHLGGWPCEMGPIMDLAREHGLWVIEDCAQSHGAEIDGRPAGSFGHAAALSFCQDKIMSTGGEGGMVLFADADACERAWSWRDHGKSRAKMEQDDHPPGYRWVHDGLGTNWRMTEMQAAIGLTQLDKLDGWLQRRAHNADVLTRALTAFPSIEVPQPRAGIRHAHYRLMARVVPQALRPGWTRDRIMTELNQAGMPCLVGACPEIYREGVYRERNLPGLPNAEALGEVSLVFLVHPTIDDAFLACCERAIADILGQATR